MDYIINDNTGSILLHINDLSLYRGREYNLIDNMLENNFPNKLLINYN